MAGATILEDTEMLSIEVVDGKVKAVVTEHGRIKCDAVVCCAGQWTRAIAATIGVSVPLVSVEHQYIITDQIPGVTHDLPTLLGAETAVMPRTTLAPEEGAALSADAPAGDAGEVPPAAVPERRPPAFRETAWFKKGEIEGYLQNPTKSGEVLVSAEDHARLSLRKGESPKTQPQKQEAKKVVPGEPMSDAEVLAEMRGGSRRAVLLLLLAAIGMLGGLAYVLLRP